ncbi:hypothetical protein BC827DRAFT_827758 [Russula dissimulans]|nr:hypothetical protein BC827DRAFT_827758 [Russula dissimulans]
MSGPSRSFPQPFESSEDQNRWPNAGNPVYTDPRYIAGGPAPPQQTLLAPTPGGYSSQLHAPSAPPSHPSPDPGFPSLPTGYSYPNRSGQPSHTVQHTAPTSVSGHSYTTQPASYHIYAPAVQHTAPTSVPGHSYTTQPASYPNYAPAVQRTTSMSIPDPSYITQPASYHSDAPVPYASYPPPHPQTTEGVQTTSGDWGYPYPRDSDDGFRQDADSEAASSSSGYLTKSPPSGPSKGRAQQSGPKSRVPPPDLLPCRLCRKFARREDVERLGGFCSEAHRWTAQTQAQAQSQGRR